MNATQRKKSPSAPSVALGDAIERALRIYDGERCHPAPIDVIAQHIGYRNAGNGAALGAIASLKYYGLLDRHKESMLSVPKDVEAYKFAPSDQTKHALVVKWLKSPSLFAELLDKYIGGLPSDATLKFDLIQRGFLPSTADASLQVFKRSVEFARYFEQPTQPIDVIGDDADEESDGMDVEEQPTTPIATKNRQHTTPEQGARVVENLDHDRIPVRLAGGRRAWIEIPMPFYKADKDRLKRQIDLLLIDDEGDNEGDAGSD